VALRLPWAVICGPYGAKAHLRVLISVKNLFYLKGGIKNLISSGAKISPVVEPGPKAGIVILGPSGLGGIARVLRIWREAGFLAEHKVKYLQSTADSALAKPAILLKTFFEYLVILLRGCDLVYIHCAVHRSFYRKILFIYAGLLFRKRIVLHIHPNEFSTFIVDLKPWAKRFVHSLLERIDAFVVLTDILRDDLRRHFPNQTIFVLKNPVNLDETAKDDGLKRERDKIVYLGWYIRAKGVFDLVDAMEVLANQGIRVRLCFYGTKQAGRLKDYVKSKGLCDRITVNGWVSGAEKSEALRTSSMLVLPSHSEGIPNVVLEAMASMTPVVATDAGGLKEVLRDGENAIVAAINNPLDLSSKILRCLHNEELRTRITENAYRDILANYHSEVIKRKLSGIVGTVLRS
jgi:glycosyltransferase involved in cell wall biosynthesis